MTAAIPPKVLQGWRVVVVDDEPDALTIVRLLLTHYGAEVVTAPDGASGLELIRRERPSFVITDLSMPVMNGWDLIDTLKKDRTLLDIPIIALTAHAMQGDREQAIARGFHNYLTKPLVPETFVASVLTLLAADFPELADVLK